ncbi:MAG TPA: peptide-methionine (S)-S-oxide reductase MsrA [Gemmatimonadales bacterium]|nr:peptide-methionine (S)-S-oxide reductase MsrA [Gemmatimonadales bacterium]
MHRSARFLAWSAMLAFVAASASAQATRQTAVLAGGCFWGIQNLFEHVKGVTQVVAGYSGGTAETASYQAVGSETTGHAESVEITFDPAVVTYQKLLDVFFLVGHDPTELNRQGPDVGSSYRSAIFYLNDQQRRDAQAVITRLTQAHEFSRPIVTQVAPFGGFYRAEEYHQDYAYHHPHDPYIVINDLPKVDHLRATFPALYRESPVLTASR